MVLGGKFTTPTPINLSSFPRVGATMRRAAITWFHSLCEVSLSYDDCRSALRIQLGLPLFLPVLAC
eukprot:2928577-Amphidinium_carterae.1